MNLMNTEGSYTHHWQSITHLFHGLSPEGTAYDPIFSPGAQEINSAEKVQRV